MKQVETYCEEVQKLKMAEELFSARRWISPASHGFMLFTTMARLDFYSAVHTNTMG